jgi:hypothetical protein
MIHVSFVHGNPICEIVTLQVSRGNGLFFNMKILDMQYFIYESSEIL